MTNAKLQVLPSATWLDECLLAARSQNRVTGVRFGRSGDPLCMRVDEALCAALDSMDSGMLAVYTVDIDEVPEFTLMYELYDPFTIMLFHRSKPVLLDAGHGPTRKITELSVHGVPLDKLLVKAVRSALELDSPLSLGGVGAGARAAPGAVTGAATSNERADDAATAVEEAQRLARQTAGWFSARMAPALERSGELWQSAEVSGWAAFERARERSRQAIDGARQKVLEKVAEQLEKKEAA